jgi:branched-chain amino acid transport system permease protein
MSSDNDVLEEISVESNTLADWLNPIKKPLRHKLGIIGLIGLAALPALLTPLQALQLAGAYFFAMFVMSWDVVSGYTGEISFGHAMFFAVGGYTSALLNLEMGLDPLLTIPVGVVAAAVFGAIIGIPALRLRGPYLSLVTLIVPLILAQIFNVYSSVFGGTQGLVSPPPDRLLNLGTGAPILTYYVSFGLFVLILAVLLAVTRSDAGRVFTAIRESEDAVSSAGLNPAKFKIFAFVLSAAVGGLAGAAFVHTVGEATPAALLDLFVSIEIIIAAILGGMGTIVGAAIGGLFFAVFSGLLGEMAFQIPLLNATIAELELVLFAVITLVLIYVLPGGLLRGGMIVGRYVLNAVGRGGGGSGGEDVAADGGTRVSPLGQVRDKWAEVLGGDDDER